MPSISALYRAEERPASILELVTRYAAASGVATKTVAVHLPGYLEIPKNWIGWLGYKNLYVRSMDFPPHGRAIGRPRNSIRILSPTWKGFQKRRSWSASWKKCMTVGSDPPSRPAYPCIRK